MDRNEAQGCLNDLVEKERLTGTFILDDFIDVLYDNNYEIVDRSIPEEHIREMTNEKE